MDYQLWGLSKNSSVLFADMIVDHQKQHYSMHRKNEMIQLHFFHAVKNGPSYMNLGYLKQDL